MVFDDKLKTILNKAEEETKKKNHPFICPEQVLLTMSCFSFFKESYTKIGGDLSGLKKDLKAYLNQYMYKLEGLGSVSFSDCLNELLSDCNSLAKKMGDEKISIRHFMSLFMEMTDSFAVYYLMKNSGTDDKYEVIEAICIGMGEKPLPPIDMIEDSEDDIGDTIKAGAIFPFPMPIFMQAFPGPAAQRPPQKNDSGWQELVTCLNNMVEKPDYIPLIGRDDEIHETIAALLRKNKSNPVHIGDAGVGKTAITMGLAKLINEDKVPDSIKGYKIYSCNMGSLLAGTIYRGEFEDKLKAVLDGVSDQKAILYIDEIHTICGAGGSSASDAANILKPYLLNDSVKIIGATTTKEYRKYIESDSALERRFLPITIGEPTREQTKEILNGIRGKYEEFHKCVYSDQMIDTIISLSGKHMNDRKFPDKAIDIMDEAGAYVSMHNVEGASVTADVIEEIVAKKCCIPRASVSADEVSRIQNLAENLKKTVIGQDDAVDKIREQIIMSRSGLRKKNKPVANLLFVGPTGVGKTFIAQTLADSLGIPLIKKDMSEFMESHSVAKLFGSPAGYVGYDEGGLLINEIRKTPYCVLLLDEIEKAHPDVYNVFLQIMDDARLSDSFGKSADFSNVILIMTSNAGAADIGNGLGFNSEIDTSSIDKAVKNTFTPEFRNRLDAIIKFNPMSKEMALMIAKNQMGILSEMLSEKKVYLTYTDDVLEHIVSDGYSKQYGARNIERTIDSRIKMKLGSEMLFGFLKNGGNCKISWDNGEYCLNRQPFM